MVRGGERRTAGAHQLPGHDAIAGIDQDADGIGAEWVPYRLPWLRVHLERYQAPHAHQSLGDTHSAVAYAPQKRSKWRDLEGQSRALLLHPRRACRPTRWSAMNHFRG